MSLIGIQTKTDMRWKATVAYDGSAFYGWQSQVGGNTVQDFIEARLAALFKRPIRIHGSSRTDSGVHARGQVFHFDGEWNHPSVTLHRALMSGMPKGILIREIHPVSEAFHARYSAIRKRYIYRFHLGFAMPHEASYTLSLWERAIAIDPMRAAIPYLIGRHDFTAFSALSKEIMSTEDVMKEITELSLKQEGNHFSLVVEGSGFLYKMVRSMMGALLEVGFGKIQPNDILRILEGKKRTHEVVTAPACGLTLEQIYYPEGLDAESA
jgi:tRNA pseudouridine38-40 synthase